MFFGKFSNILRHLMAFQQFSFKSEHLGWPWTPGLTPRRRLAAATFAAGRTACRRAERSMGSRECHMRRTLGSYAWPLGEAIVVEGGRAVLGMGSRECRAGRQARRLSRAVRRCHRLHMRQPWAGVKVADRLWLWSPARSATVLSGRRCLWVPWIPSGGFPVPRPSRR